MDNLQVLFNIALGVAAFFGGWMVNSLTRSIERLDKDVRELPHTYVLQANYHRDVEEIKTMLARIFDKLDNKADK